MVNRIYILLLICIITASCKEKTPLNKKNETTTFYLIRHAEKDRSNPSEQNPNLTLKGLNRAQNWAKYFDSIPINSIYTTSFNRTKQTINPVSNIKNITPKIYSPNKIDIQNFIKTNKGKNVLISGHSNTTPEMVNKLINQPKFQDMIDSDNKSLFVVQIIDTKVSIEVRSVSISNQ